MILLRQTKDQVNLINKTYIFLEDSSKTKLNLNFNISFSHKVKIINAK